ncbi:hypothetical protein [Gloeocapsopsis dulcis]|nr:hypothetical protein [Gloeocapsopsis dulcis]WNN87547.1 hypothetical protein P0S91_14570 [Gloeocapsopsis dulcis]
MLGAIAYNSDFSWERSHKSDVRSAIVLVLRKAQSPVVLRYAQPYNN